MNHRLWLCLLWVLAVSKRLPACAGNLGEVGETEVIFRSDYALIAAMSG